MAPCSRHRGEDIISCSSAISACEEGGHWKNLGFELIFHWWFWGGKYRKLPLDDRDSEMYHMKWGIPFFFVAQVAKRDMNVNPANTPQQHKK